MRALLDECVPRRLKRALSGHDVHTVADMGRAGTRNGDLLRRAASLFDVFVPVDRGIEHEHKLASLGIGIVLLVARSNDIADLEPLMADVRVAMADVRPGQVVQALLLPPVDDDAGLQQDGRDPGGPEWPQLVEPVDASRRVGQLAPLIGDLLGEVERGRHPRPEERVAKPLGQRAAGGRRPVRPRDEE